MSWTSLRYEPPNRPTFHITGATLLWRDGVPAQAKQGPFQWRGDAWEANLELGRPRGVAFAVDVEARLRLTPAVLEDWSAGSIEPAFETCRQVQMVLRATLESAVLGTIELAGNGEPRALGPPLSWQG